MPDFTSLSNIDCINSKGTGLRSASAWLNILPAGVKRQASPEQSFSGSVNPIFLAAQRRQAGEETIYREDLPTEYSQSVHEQSL